MRLAVFFCLAVALDAQEVPDRLLVRANSTLSATAIFDLEKAQGAELDHEIASLHIHVLKVPELTKPRILRALQASGRFDFVEPDFIGHENTVPNDPLYSNQWHLPKISAPVAWSLTQGSTLIPLVILDSGVDHSHPDLDSKILPGKNFVDGSSNTQEVGCSSGHGTAVTGAALAIGNNALGVAGLAWLNPIVPGVIDSFAPSSTECQFQYSNLATAITWAADNGYRVINVSGAGTSSSSTIQSAVDYAWSKNALVIAAAGNSGSSAPNYPAACNHVLAIGATLSNDTLATWSNYGSWIALVAPGYNIWTTQKGGTYGGWWGTSFASPLVAAAAVLALSVNPSLTNVQLITVLEQNTDDLGTTGFDDKFGWGRLNVGKLISSLKPSFTAKCKASLQNFSGAVAVPCTASGK